MVLIVIVEPISTVVNSAEVNSIVCALKKLEVNKAIKSNFVFIILSFNVNVLIVLFLIIINLKLLFSLRRL